MGWTIQGLNPDRSKRFFSSLYHLEWLWGPATLLFNGYQDSPLEVNSWSMVFMNSPSFCAKVVNEYSHTSAPPKGLHGMYRDNFTSFS